MSDEHAEPDTKQCEFCGETIKAAAIKCKYCGEGLGGKKLPHRNRPQQKIDSAATISMATGAVSILGMLFCIVFAFAAPIAIWKGNEARKLAKAAGLPVPGNAIAGLVMGWISLGFVLLGIVFVAIVIGIEALK